MPANLPWSLCWQMSMVSGSTLIYSKLYTALEVTHGLANKFEY